MPNIIGSITINQSKLVELDASPLSSPTTGIEVGDFCIVDGLAGVWQKKGSGTYDFTRVDQLSSISTQATAAGTLVMVPSSSSLQIFTGTTSGQLVNLPDATNLGVGTRFEFWNLSTQDVALRDNGGAGVITIPSGSVCIAVLEDNSTSGGSWLDVCILPPSGGVAYGSPVTISDSTNSDGVSTAVARADHVHSHGTRGGGTLHDLATTSLAGFMSAVDKTKLDALQTRAGRTTGASFSGSPKKVTINFTAFNPATTNYTITVTGADVRSWSYESKTNTSFVINANANAAFTGEVSWHLQLDGTVGV